MQYIKPSNTDEDITNIIRNVLHCNGADLVGFGDLTQLPENVRCGLPFGICVAVRYPKEIIKGIEKLPTKEYYEQYHILNEKLDMLVTLGAETVKGIGYDAVAQTLAYVGQFENDLSTRLPHKTVATRAGLGWIGKSALFVTKEYGSAIRISSILTDAPVKTAKPINCSECGDCMICKDACPAGAVLGKIWTVNTFRDEFFNAELCRETARKRSFESFGIEVTQCGKCILVCPWTQKYLNADVKNRIDAANMKEV